MDSTTSRDNQGRSKARWTPEEDAILTRLVQLHGCRNWAQISNRIKGRSGRSCRTRWLNQLSPIIDHSPFTPEEDAIIIQARGSFGWKWFKIARLFNGRRTDNAIKNRWNSTLQHRLHNRVSSSNLNSVSHGGSFESDGYRSENEVEPFPNPDQVNSNHANAMLHGGSSKTDDDVNRPVVEAEQYPYPDKVSFKHLYSHGMPFYSIQEGFGHFSNPIPGLSIPGSDSGTFDHLGKPSLSHGGSVPYGGLNMQNQPPQVAPLASIDKGKNGFHEMVVDVTREEVIKYKNQASASGDAFQSLPTSDVRKSLSTHKFNHLVEPSSSHGGFIPFGGFNMQNQPPQVVPIASNDKGENGFQDMVEDVTREEVIKYKNQASASGESCSCNVDQLVHEVLRRIGFQRDEC